MHINHAACTFPARRRKKTRGIVHPAHILPTVDFARFGSYRSTSRSFEVRHALLQGSIAGLEEKSDGWAGLRTTYRFIRVKLNRDKALRHSLDDGGGRVRKGASWCSYLGPRSSFCLGVASMVHPVAAVLSSKTTRSENALRHGHDEHRT